MRRVAEPELMLDEEQIKAYAQADFAAPHSYFMELLCKQLDSLPQTGVALDLGCGPGDISRRFAAAFPGWRVDGVDGSAAMLAMARTMTPSDAPVQYIERLLPSAPTGRYDLIISNSLLHHLSDPAVLWSTIRDWAGQHSCRVFIMDLMRPDDQATAEALVMLHAADEPAVLRHDFLYSLLAAYEAAEISEQIHRAGLALHVEVVSDRHVIAWGDVN
jgi:trans-aconitate methyltransferase